MALVLRTKTPFGLVCCKVYHLSRVGRTRHFEGRTGSLLSRRFVLGPVLIFPNSLPNLSSDKTELVPGYAGDKFSTIWLSPTSRLGTGGPLCNTISFTSFAITVNSMGDMDSPNGNALNLYDLPWM